MHDKDPNVREETNQLRRRSKGTKLMNNFDQMTRRNFLARVTTLAGGVAVATSAGLLAGCGSDNGSSSGGNTKAPGLPASPGPTTPVNAVSMFASEGVLPTDTKLTLTPVRTLTATDAVDGSSIAAALVAAIGSDPTAFAFPQGSGADLSGVSGFATAKSLGLSAAEVTEGLTNLVNDFIAAGLVSFTSGQQLSKSTYTTHGQTYTSATITDPTTGVTIFDPILSLLVTTTNPKYAIDQDVPNGSTGQGRYTNYNVADGHLVTDVAGSATLNTEVNGNLNTANPATPNISSVNSDPATDYDPTPPATTKSVAISKAPNGRDTIITISFSHGGVNFTVIFDIGTNGCVTIYITWALWKRIRISRGHFHLVHYVFHLSFHVCLPTGTGGF